MPRERHRGRPPEPSEDTRVIPVEAEVAKALCNGLGDKYRLKCREAGKGGKQILEGMVWVEITTRGRINPDVFTEIQEIKTGKNLYRFESETNF